MQEFFDKVKDLFEDFEINRLEDVVLAFSFIKLVDDALKFSKRDVVQNYKLCDDFNNGIHNFLLTHARYINGDQLGFYNYSEWDLDKLSNVNEDSISKKFKIYLNSFSDNIKSFLDLLNFSDFLNSLDDLDLHSLVCNLNDIYLDENIFNSYENLNYYYNLFLIKYNAYFKLSNYISFINSVFMDCYYQYGDNVLIEICDDGLLINNNQGKYDMDNIYLCEENEQKFPIVLSRMIIANYKLSNVAKTNDFNCSSFDLIISHNYAKKSIMENVRNHLEKLKYASKIIFTIPSYDVDEVRSLLSQLSKKDVLEAVIMLPIYENYEISAIVLNNDKKEILKDSFLLINENNLLKDNKHVFNWKFIISKLSNNIKSKYLNPQEFSNLISYSFNENQQQKVFKPTKRKHAKENEMKYEISLRDTKNDAKDYFENKLINISKKFEDTQKMENSGENENAHALNCSNIEDYNFERDRPNLDDFIKKASDLLKCEIEVAELSQIADLTIPVSLDDNSLYIVNNENFNDRMAFFGYELNNIHYSNLIKVELQSENIALKYLNVFINSKTGLNELEYATKYYHDINSKNVGKIRILIPNLVNQIFIVNAYEEGEEFLKTITSFVDNFQNNIFDYKNMINSIKEFRGEIKLDSEGCEVTEMNQNWRYAYARLIWPLAITYLSATRGAFEITDKARRYLVLFEFIAAFNSIVLISGLPNEVYNEYKYSKLWNLNPISYNNMEFGKWTHLSKSASEIYREQDFTTDFDRKLFDSISTKKINSLLKKVNFIRNELYHGSMTTYRQYELILEKLNGHLSEIFDILDIYSEYKLFYVLGYYEVDDDDMVKNRVIHLNGPCKQPIYGYFKFHKMLKKGSLFLYNPITKKLLRLNDNLIKFKPIDDLEKRWGIYVFNGFYKNKKGKLIAKYKYFQETEDEYRIGINSFEEDIVG